MNNEYVLAIDGGATNCRGLLCTTDGTVLASAQGGSCNYQNVGLDNAINQLREVVNIVMPDRTRRLKVAVFGLAGVDTQEDHRLIAAAIGTMLSQSEITCEKVLIDNDALITLLGAVGQDDGVLVIAGTGMIACGITQAGNLARAGGWGHLLDESGSGYAIGKAALTHVMRVYDGRDPCSGVVKAVLDQLRLADAQNVVNWVYSENCSIERVAALTPVICALAEQGDLRAKVILDDAAVGLRTIAMAVISRLELQPFPFQLLLSGGLLRNAPIIRNRLVELLQEDCPKMSLIDAQYPPICGAVLRALQEEAIDRRHLLERLHKQLVEIK